MNQADSINDQEPLVKIVRGICKVDITIWILLLFVVSGRTNKLQFVTKGEAVPGSRGPRGCWPRPQWQRQASAGPPCQGWCSLSSRQLWARPRILSERTKVEESFMIGGLSLHLIHPFKKLNSESWDFSPRHQESHQSDQECHRAEGSWLFQHHVRGG